ncbi:hypothetical protein MMC30_000011 [Trapelia coarctata]|nr:hypothetical protein [Trapelia coarctata]
MEFGFLKEPLQYEELMALPEPTTILQILDRIEKIGNRQLINMCAVLRCKVTYRRHLDAIIELDTVAKATLSARTYHLLRDAEMVKMKKTEATMTKMRAQGTHLADIKKGLVDMENSMWHADQQ